MTGRHVDATYAAEHHLTVVTSPSDLERLRARLGELKPPKKLIGEQVVRNCRSQQADVLDKVVQQQVEGVGVLGGIGAVLDYKPSRLVVIEQLLETVRQLLNVADAHESSPSVSGGAPENTSPVLTVGDAADASASSPAGASAAPSGGVR